MLIDGKSILFIQLGRNRPMQWLKRSETASRGALFFGVVVIGVLFIQPGHQLSADVGKDRSQPGGISRVLRLPPSNDNPRNSEGAFIRLKDGRVMFVYSRFTGGKSDHAAAYLAARFSSDEGRTWTEHDAVVLSNEGGMNVMSVSLLRLGSGDIALFYVRKNSLVDCRPCVRWSRDEGKTWSEATTCIQDEVDYYVLNNDRVVQMRNERIVVPVAQHTQRADGKFNAFGRIVCYLSDDQGKTWRRGAEAKAEPSSNANPVILQEPGVVELKDSRLMLFCRTNAGSQFVAHSSDRGESWTSLEPSAILSPLSPASIKRIPGTERLLLAWNDHRNIHIALKNKRTPFRVAVSDDEGRTWKLTKTIEDDPDGWYCYTAIEFVNGSVLLGHCAGKAGGGDGLSLTQVVRFDIDWLLAKPQ